MFRKTMALSALAIAGITAGCRMCESPYDYCGPVLSGDYSRDCRTDFRAGSVLNRPEQSAADGEAVEPSPMPPSGVGTSPDTEIPDGPPGTESSPVPAVSEGATGVRFLPAEGSREGATRILSITDEKVKEPAP